METTVRLAQLPPPILAHVQQLSREVEHAIALRDNTIWTAVRMLGYQDLKALNVDIATGDITVRGD